MKHTLLTIGHLFFLTLLYGQSLPFSVTPAAVEESFQVDLSNTDLDVELYAEVKNLSEDTIRLVWNRIVMDAPEGWLTQVCDNNACYNPDVSSNYIPDLEFDEPFELAPDSTFSLTLYVLPNGVAGTGEFDLDFSLRSEPGSVLETVMFRANISDLTTSITTPSLEEIRLFPNPTTDYIELTDTEDIDQLIVYNVLGAPVRRFNVMDGKRYYLSSLSDGMYLVSLVSRQSGILKTLRISKRSLRP